MSDEEKRKQAASRAIDAFQKNSALRSLSITEEVLKAHEASGIGALQKAYGATAAGSLAKVMEAARLASTETGVGATLKAMAAQQASLDTGIGAILRDLAVQQSSIDKGIGATLKAMTDRHSSIADQMKQIVKAQRSPFDDIMLQHRETMAGLAAAVESYKTALPTAHLRMDAFANLSIERYGTAFERLNLDRVIGSEFQTLTKGLAEQISAHRAAVTVPKLDMGLSANIGDLLARSLQAQERLLEEQRAFYAEQREADEAKDAKARLDRRLTYFLALIQVLSFLFMVALEIEGRWQETEEAERAEADRSEIIQMREAIETMGVQLEMLQQIEADRAEREDQEAKREAESDAELALIMREIADGLRAAEGESTDKEE